MSKKCSKCKITKEYIHFNKNKVQKDGYAHYCKECRVVERGGVIGITNIKKPILSKEECLAVQRIRHKKWRDSNPGYYKKRNELWRKSNPNKTKNNDKNRVDRLKRASLTPNFYKQVQHISRLVENTIYTIDHIIPIAGKNVCGLNVPWNLQVLTKTQNLQKHCWFDNNLYQKWRKNPNGPLIRPKP